MTRFITIAALAVSFGFSGLAFVLGIPATAQELAGPTPEPSAAERIDVALGLPQEGYEVIVNPALYGLPPVEEGEMYVRLDTEIFRMQRTDAAILDTVASLSKQ